MSQDIPENVRQFIFSYIDSVEQLEVLMLLRSRPEQSHTPKFVASEMRSSEGSVTTRLENLHRLGFVIGDSTKGYRYASPSAEMAQALSDLDKVYRVFRHKVLELIFSPMKKARSFADAFVVKSPKNEDENG